MTTTTTRKVPDALTDAPTEPLLSPMQLAEYLGVPVMTTRRWRVNGDGPRGYRIGKHVRYRHTDVEAWLETRADAA